ncbi:MAG TPA: type II secretion system protein [Acidobacteriaceae bacterium]|jgi:hypothetical protein|nr:type II secretion system protein [Acidobacteriaceae bacterium]
MTTDPQIEKGRRRPTQAAAEEGYMLLGLLVLVAILLLWLGVAATNEAFAIRREREVETARRADQYVRAIRRYYFVFHHYPGSVDQLEKTNNVRFLRRKWIDPLTHTTDWRTIAVGQNKTTPRGFFGEPLAGLPTVGLGAPAGSPQGTSGVPAAGAAIGTPSGGLSFGGPTPAPAAAAGALTSTGTPDTGAAGAGGGAGTAGAGIAPTGTSAAGGASATPTNSPFGSSGGAGGNNGVFMGIGSNATGNSILEINGQTTYQTWEFLYDPRVEQLRLKQQLNSGLQSSGTGGFGQTPSSSSPGTAAPGTTTPAPPQGTTPAPGNSPAPGGDTPIR